VNLLDLLLVVIVGVSVVSGFVAGFARIGIGFVAAVTGLTFGFWFYGIPAAWIHRHVNSQTASNLMGFFIVFLGFIFAGALFGKFLAKLLKWTGLSWFDRLVGGVFGAVRGGFIAVAVVAVLMAFTPRPLPNWMVDSKLLPYAIDASDLCAAVAPRALKDAFREGVREIRKAWDEEVKKKQRKKKESDLKKVES
jgi:membrane protein required for colicin V production